MLCRHSCISSVPLVFAKIILRGLVINSNSMQLFILQHAWIVSTCDVSNTNCFNFVPSLSLVQIGKYTGRVVYDNNVAACAAFKSK